MLFFINYLMMPMKKIKNIQELKVRKKELEQRKEELEKALKYDWRDVKESLQPASIAKQLLGSVFSRKEKEGSNKGFLSKIAAMFMNRKNKQEDF